MSFIEFILITPIRDITKPNINILFFFRKCQTIYLEDFSNRTFS